MEIDFYNSPITIPALAACGGAAFLIYRRYKNTGYFSLLFGFLLLIASKISANFCTGISQIENAIDNYPLLCNSITPYIEGIGYILIAYGLSIFLLEKTHNKAIKKDV